MRFKRGKKLAIILGSLGCGGAEKVMLQLAAEFSERGYTVDLVVGKKKGQLINDIPLSVNLFELQKNNFLSNLKYYVRLPLKSFFIAVILLIFRKHKIFRRLPSLVQYINESKPDVILSTLYSVNITALWARSMFGGNLKVIIRQATMHSQHIMNAKTIFDKYLLSSLINQWYAKADHIITVSHAMRNDLKSTLQLNTDSVSTIYNPVNVDYIHEKTHEEIDDEWYLSGIPIIIAVGRLDHSKDFPTLLHAIKRINNVKRVNLAIIGSGSEYPRLYKLIEELGISDMVRLQGYDENPYKYMALANVHVLSSAWEGMPNVLLEALACGCKIVSTDCLSGPREILHNGEYGKLVDVGDASMLAEAILCSMDQVVDKNKLINRARKFSINHIVTEYERLIFGEA